MKIKFAWLTSTAVMELRNAEFFSKSAVGKPDSKIKQKIFAIRLSVTGKVCRESRGRGEKHLL